MNDRKSGLTNFLECSEAQNFPKGKKQKNACVIENVCKNNVLKRFEAQNPYKWSLKVDCSTSKWTKRMFFHLKSSLHINR